MRRIAPALAAALLAVVPIACGGDGEAVEERSSESSLADVAGTTEDAGTARVSVTMTTSVGGLPAPVALEGEGVVDFENETSSTTFDLSELAEATGGLFDGEMEVRAIGSVVFMRFPAALSALLGGKEWVSLDLEEAGELQGLEVEALAQAGSDPTQWLELAGSGGVEYEEVGQEDVRGVPTTHYAGMLSLRALAEEGPDHLRESFEALAEAGVDELQSDIWIDGEGRARRVEVEQPLPDAGPVEGTQSFRQEYYDFGVDVEIEAPPADQVTDLSELR